MFGVIRLKACLWFSIFSFSVLVTLSYLLPGTLLCNSFHENVLVTSITGTSFSSEAVTLWYQYRSRSKWMRYCKEQTVFSSFLTFEHWVTVKNNYQEMHHTVSKQKWNRNIVMWFCSPISDCLYGFLGHLWESPYWNSWIISLLSHWLYGAWYITGRQICCATALLDLVY